MIAVMVPVSNLGAQYTQWSLVGSFVALLLIAAIVNRPAPRRLVSALAGIAAVFGVMQIVMPCYYWWFC